MEPLDPDFKHFIAAEGLLAVTDAVEKMGLIPSMTRVVLKTWLYLSDRVKAGATVEQRDKDFVAFVEKTWKEEGCDDEIRSSEQLHGGQQNRAGHRNPRRARKS